MCQGPSAAEFADLREECINYGKERAAIRTILESKVMVLVGDIAAALRETLSVGARWTDGRTQCSIGAVVQQVAPLLGW
jgi:hypothetical protein